MADDPFLLLGDSVSQSSSPPQGEKPGADQTESPVHTDGRNSHNPNLNPARTIMADMKDIRRFMSEIEKRMFSMEKKMLTKIKLLEINVNSLRNSWATLQAPKAHPGSKSDKGSYFGGSALPDMHVVTTDSLGVPNISPGDLIQGSQNGAQESKAKGVESDAKKGVPTVEERKWLENKLRSLGSLSAREIFNEWKLKFHLSKTPPKFGFLRTGEQMHAGSLKFLQLSTSSKPQNNKKKAKDLVIMDYFRKYLENPNL
ncbi:hypothetical protein AAMO2058_000158800 [Amorphochlora amoebiformis]